MYVYFSKVFEYIVQFWYFTSGLYFRMDSLCILFSSWVEKLAQPCLVILISWLTKCVILLKKYLVINYLSFTWEFSVSAIQVHFKLKGMFVYFIVEECCKCWGCGVQILFVLIDQWDLFPFRQLQFWTLCINHIISTLPTK